MEMNEMLWFRYTFTVIHYVIKVSNKKSAPLQERTFIINRLFGLLYFNSR